MSKYNQVIKVLEFVHLNTIQLYRKNQLEKFTLHNGTIVF